VIHRLDELDPAALAARLEAKASLVLGLGTIEWHGLHLPLGLDLLKAHALAERTAERAGAVLAPPAWWAAGGVPQPCTLRLSPSVTDPVLSAVLDAFAGMGFRAICLLNGHYGLENSPPCACAAVACAGATGDHAGVFETALLMPDRPDLVHLDVEGDLQGVIGEDPRGAATRELGEHGLELASARAADTLDRALVEPRKPIADALKAAVRALEALWELRHERPPDQVPPVATPSWIRHLESIRDGNWRGAQEAAEEKLADAAA
jgi:creatinine amidohydrolase